MPNYCNGVMRVRGYKDNVDELIRILQADYDYTGWVKDPVNGVKVSHKPHFCRIFEAELVKSSMVYGLIKYVEIDLEVAWSIYCCMFDGPWTYYADFCKEYGQNHFASNIVRESQRLQLDIEIWSYEPGVGFQEHYRINSGVVIANAEYRYVSEYIGDMDYTDFRKTYGNLFPTIKSESMYKDLLEYTEIITTDMHEETWSFDQDDKPMYLGLIKMC